MIILNLKNYWKNKSKLKPYLNNIDIKENCGCKRIKYIVDSTFFQTHGGVDEEFKFI